MPKRNVRRFGASALACQVTRTFRQGEAPSRYTHTHTQTHTHTDTHGLEMWALARVDWLARQ